MFRTPHAIIFRVIKSKKLDGRDMKHVWRRGEMYTRFWFGNLRERDHLEDPNVDGMVIIRSFFRRLDVGAWTGSNISQDRDR